MDKEFLGIVAAVIDLKISERYIADNHIKVVVWQLRFLKALYGDVRFLIELLCNPACEFVNFHAVELAACHTVGKQTKEIARAAGRL